MPLKEGINSRYDEAWKVALELFFEPFLLLCFPQVHATIEWRHAPEFLDTELRRIAPEHARGLRSVDKLVKVRLLNGEEEWLFVHVEVQTQRDGHFSERVWTYFYRLWDRHHHRIISLAVLADADSVWRPALFVSEFAGCLLRFEFPTFKVIDFPDAVGVFERTGNPFALLIAAHQTALATRTNMDGRYLERFRLLRYLRRGGLEKTVVWNLLRLIQWLTRLPPESELRFWREWDSLPATQRIMTIDELKSPLEFIMEEQAMERAMKRAMPLAMEKAMEKARETHVQLILETLELRFGSVPDDLRARLAPVTGEEEVIRLHRRAVTARSLAEFQSGL